MSSPYVPTFGDKEYLTSEFNAQYAHHSNAPATYLIGNALRQTYQYAQTKGQICIAQSYPFNIQNVIGDIGNKRQFLAINSTDFVGIARARRELPLQFSHLKATVIFSVHEFNRVKVVHKLTAVKGGACDSATREMEIEDAQQTARVSNGVLQASQNWVHSREIEYPFSSAFKIYEDTVELQFTNIDPSVTGVMEIRLGANANQINSSYGGGYSIPVPYQPIYCLVVAEMRYS